MFVIPIDICFLFNDLDNKYLILSKYFFYNYWLEYLIKLHLNNLHPAQIISIKLIHISQQKHFAHS